ncbi:MAG TPA: response regulator transcription factor [Candidatus Saccharimonadales bacterium]|nr:response regulator transcription factor [Candidatus Saccharimonadales bacterium]
MRILIIEDDHKIAQAIKKGLEQERFAVDLAFDGGEGAGSALTIKYDLIILDRMLPGMDGIDICKVVRQKGKNTPILMLTAKDAVSDRVDGLNAGADDYLVKPFAFEELLARVKALLRRPEQEIGSTLELNGLSLDTISFEVKRGEKPIELSSTEFRLLEYLMRNPNRVLTKDMIINHVWDYDADILPNTVEVFVGYLRNKIDKAFPDKKPIIQTVRGFGYKLVDDK